MLWMSSTGAVRRDVDPCAQLPRRSMRRTDRVVVAADKHIDRQLATGDWHHYDREQSRCDHGLSVIRAAWGLAFPKIRRWPGNSANALLWFRSDPDHYPLFSEIGSLLVKLDPELRYAGAFWIVACHVRAYRALWKPVLIMQRRQIGASTTLVGC